MCFNYVLSYLYPCTNCHAFPFILYIGLQIHAQQTATEFISTLIVQKLPSLQHLIKAQPCFVKFSTVHNVLYQQRIFHSITYSLIYQQHKTLYIVRESFCCMLLVKLLRQTENICLVNWFCIDNG